MLDLRFEITSNRWNHNKLKWQRRTQCGNTKPHGIDYLPTRSKMQRVGLPASWYALVKWEIFTSSIYLIAFNEICHEVRMFTFLLIQFTKWNAHLNMPFVHRPREMFHYAEKIARNWKSNVHPKFFGARIQPSCLHAYIYIISLMAQHSPPYQIRWIKCDWVMCQQRA